MGFNQNRSLPTRLPDNVLRDMRKDLGMDCVNYYNFAVCGASGTGKSSLINAFCGYKEGEAWAAAIGKYDIGTTKTRAYKPERYPHVSMWDIPGTNHTTCPLETYFTDQRLAAFDALIIVSDTNRFTVIDEILAKRAQSVAVPVIFVRTKADSEIHQELMEATIRGAGTAETKQEVAERVKRNIKKLVVPELDQIGMKAATFVVISAYSLDGKHATYPQLDKSYLIEHIEALAESRRRK